MKKHVALIAVLLLISIGATVIFGNEISASKTRITITENIIFGDKSAANGITVQEQSQYGSHIFWDTVYKISSEPYLNTEYTFYSNEQRDSTVIYNGLYIAVRDGYGCNFSKPIEEQVGIAKAYKELFDETLPGEQQSRMIKLSDYYDFYPVSPNIDIPDLHWTNIDYENLLPAYKSEKEVRDRFTEFFKIPMLESEIVSISVGKDIYGNLSMTGSGNGYYEEAEETADYYSPETVCAYNSTVCYFSFSNRTFKDNTVDTSGIEDGYGIYKINYTVGKYRDENGNFSTGIDPASLNTCFPLDEEFSVCSMWLSKDGSNLFCILLDMENNAFFTQIDTAKMETVTTIPLKNNVQKYEITVYPYEDFSAILIADALTVLSPNANGVYIMRFSVPLSEYVSESFGWLYDTAVMDYNGERLVVVGNLPEKLYMTYQTCDFYVAVYGANGLEYYAEYKNSLSVNSYSGSYKANCHPVKIKVDWN